MIPARWLHVVGRGSRNTCIDIRILFQDYIVLAINHNIQLQKKLAYILLRKSLIVGQDEIV